MQFTQSADGYAIKELYRFESAKKIFSLKGDANFAWNNPKLAGIEQGTLDKYFALVGQEFWSMYKKTIKSWEKFAQTALDKAEKDIVAMGEAAAKKLKGVNDQKKIEAAKKKVTEAADKLSKKIEQEIQTKYQELLPSLSKKAHDTVVKKLGKAGGTLKKHHGKAIFKAVLFAVAVTAVVLAAVALGPLGGAALAIGIAAVVVKSIAVLSKGVKDLRAYIKEWNKVSEKAAQEIDTATAAVDKALKAMDACHTVREALQLKVAAAQNEVDKANSGLTDASDKKIASLKKKADASKKELEELEKFIGDNTGDLLKHLKAAHSSMNVVKAKKPKKFVGTLETAMDFVSGVGELAT